MYLCENCVADCVCVNVCVCVVCVRVCVRVVRAAVRSGPAAHTAVEHLARLRAQAEEETEARRVP